jgi:hypothetical protein
MEKQKRILSKFEKLGIDPKLWVYVGSNYSNIIIDSELVLFQKYFPNQDYPQLEDRCICGARIKENYYITTKDYNYNNITVIGSECYKEFIENKTIKCLVCNEEHTDSLTNNAKYKHLCKTCVKTKKQWYLKNKKNITVAKNDLIAKYRVELDAMYHNHSYDVDELYNKFKRKRDDIQEQEKYKKIGKYDIYINKIILKQSDSLVNEYRKSLDFHLNELNNQYKIKHNSFELFNKFNKLKENRKYIKFVNKDEYNIACIYINYTHVSTINLVTMRQTKNSPSKLIL